VRIFSDSHGVLSIVFEREEERQAMMKLTTLGDRRVLDSKEEACVIEELADYFKQNSTKGEEHHGYISCEPRLGR